MSKGEYLGEFEQMVLLALLRLKDDAYGVTVRREIENRTNRRVAIGAVYACLERLERKGYVSSVISEPQPVPGGRSRKYFCFTRAGAEALQQSREMMQRMVEGMAVDSELEAILPSTSLPGSHYCSYILSFRNEIGSLSSVISTRNTRRSWMVGRV